MTKPTKAYGVLYDGSFEAFQQLYELDEFAHGHIKNKYYSPFCIHYGGFNGWLYDNEYTIESIQDIPKLVKSYLDTIIYHEKKSSAILIECHYDSELQRLYRGQYLIYDKHKDKFIINDKKGLMLDYNIELSG